MRYDFEHYREILGRGSAFRTLERETTIFTVGGQGYYENPATDLLAFFCNPHEVHGLSTLVLEALVEGIRKAGGSAEVESLPGTFVGRPRREEETEEGKRIDLVLEGDRVVIVLENKIYHHQNNPFDLYEDFARTKYQNKTLVLVVLSPSGTAPPGWIGLPWGSLTASVTERLGPQLVQAPITKWTHYLRDYLKTIEHYCVRHTMDDQAFKFVNQHYADITKMQLLRQSFLEKIVRKVKDEISSDRELTQDWGGGASALRFYRNPWPDQSNVTLHIKPTENDVDFIPLAYVYTQSEEDRVDVRGIMGDRPDYEGRGRILVYREGTVHDIDTAIERLAGFAAKIDSSRGISSD